MKRILSLILLSAMTIGMAAQEVVTPAESVNKNLSVGNTTTNIIPQGGLMGAIAYLSYDQALKSMPDYTIAQKSIENLRRQYDAEMKSAEKEFNEKYELFLEQQSKLASAIREKRQSELQLMLERNVKFREESQRLLLQAEDEAMAPLQTKLNNVLSEIGTEKQYAVIVNTDSNACPFINPLMSEDITSIVIERLKK